MSSRTRRVNVEIDGAGAVGAFVLGIGIGVFLIWPTLPPGVQNWSPGQGGIQVGPVGAPLLLGVGLFLAFFLGTFLLNMIFLSND